MDAVVGSLAGKCKRICIISIDNAIISCICIASQLKENPRLLNEHIGQLRPIETGAVMTPRL
jgi:hypothetical protein